ncbi:MAG: CPBP family intramembrane glutamic endopeptidase [Phycisphaerae bacterium]
MELTATQVDWILILAGLLVWAKLLTFYASRRHYLKIDPQPQTAAIQFGVEAILIVFILFLLSGQLIQQFLEKFLVTTGLNDLSRQMLADTAAKLVAGTGIIYLLSRFAKTKALFGEPSPSDHSFWTNIPRWVKVILISVIVYLAIYPLVNVLLLSAGIIFFQKVLHLTVPESHQAFQLLSDKNVPLFVKADGVLLAAIVSPIIEELFFRGLVQNYLYKLFCRPMIAIMVTSIFFMLVHYPLLQQMPALWMLGVILGWSYYRYRTLTVPMLIHVIFNSVSLALWWLGGIG